MKINKKYDSNILIKYYSNCSFDGKPTNWNNILLKKIACDDLMLSRYYLPDLYYDLLTDLGTIEKKLIDSNKIESCHYFYQKILTKTNNHHALRQEFNYFTSLVFAEKNIHEHWNNSHLLLKTQKDDIIYNELSLDNIKSYKNLKKIFNDNDFINAQQNEINLNKFSNSSFLNILEYSLLNYLCTAEKQNIDLYNEFKQLNIPNNIEKHINAYALKKIKYNKLIDINDENLTNKLVPSNYPECTENFISLNNVAKINFALESIYNFVTKKKTIIGFDNKKYNLIDYLSYLKKDNFFHNNFLKILKYKQKNSTTKKNKTIWLYIILNFNNENTINNNEINNKKLKI